METSHLYFLDMHTRFKDKRVCVCTEKTQVTREIFNGVPLDSVASLVHTWQITGQSLPGEVDRGLWESGRVVKVLRRCECKDL